MKDVKRLDVGGSGGLYFPPVVLIRIDIIMKQRGCPKRLILYRNCY